MELQMFMQAISKPGDVIHLKLLMYVKKLAYLNLKLKK